MNEENNSKGIILVLVSMALFSFQDALIKFVFEKAALYEIYFGRTFIASVILGAYLFFRKQKIKFKTEYPFLTVIRVVLHFFAFSFFFISLTYMSLAMANALFFSSPFFISIFAKFFLNEQIGIRRWSAIFLGFIGIYIVLNPDFSEFEYKNLLPVLCAFFYAISMTITKITSDKDNLYTQLFYFYTLAIGLCLIIFIFFGSGEFNKYNDPTMQFIFREWFSNTTYAWKYILIMGAMASISFVCIFKAYSSYSPSVVSLFEYSLIIWSIIIGYLLFSEIPTLRTFIGISLIISAGIYIFVRERVRKQDITLKFPKRR